MYMQIASYNLSRVVRKPAYCICENKDADQLRGDREADQRFCFRYTDSTIRNFKPLVIFCDCTARFVSNLVGNPEDRFSQNEAHFISVSVSTRKPAGQGNKSVTPKTYTRDI